VYLFKNTGVVQVSPSPTTDAEHDGLLE